MRFVPATEALLRQFYSGGMLRLTVVAHVIVDDGGAPIAVGGFIRIRGHHMAVFSDHAAEAAQNHKLTAYKFAKMLMETADRNGWVLHAEPAALDTAPALLKRLGFERGEDGHYVRGK